MLPGLVKQKLSFFFIMIFVSRTCELLMKMFTQHQKSEAPNTCVSAADPGRVLPLKTLNPPLTNIQRGIQSGRAKGS